jgi:hypothetical protein
MKENKASDDSKMQGKVCFCGWSTIKRIEENGAIRYTGHKETKIVFFDNFFLNLFLLHTILRFIQPHSPLPRFRLHKRQICGQLLRGQKY